jgi:hypothetical protein
MRVALLDCFNEEQDVNLLKINKSFKDCIFFDTFDNEIDEAIYCVDIRVYDMIFINFKESFYKKYLNIIGTLNRDYDLKYKLYIFIEDLKDSSFITFKDLIKSYKNLEVEFISFPKKNLINYISSKTEEIFKEIPNIKTISVNHELKVLVIQTNDGIVELPILKMIDLQVILYFLRHYGEVININSIVSSISNEPEFMSNSPIESSISSIRKLFQSSIGLNPIKAFKRVGYQFKLA